MGEPIGEAVLVIKVDMSPKPREKLTEWDRQMQQVIDTCDRAPEVMEELRALARDMAAPLVVSHEEAEKQAREAFAEATGIPPEDITTTWEDRP